MNSSDIQQLLNSSDYGDRLSGLNFLRQLPPVEGWRMLKPLIKDSNARVRYSAVSQIDTLGQVDPEEALEMIRDRLSNDSEIDVRSAAADAIAGLKLTAGFEDLLKAYQETSEWLLQFSIIACLGELGDPRAFDLLKDALLSPNELFKTAAISSFGELGDLRALPLLLPFSTNEDWQIRYRLAQALGYLKSPENRETLERLALDPVKEVALEAKRSLRDL
jgi:HEAT repeat protein